MGILLRNKVLTYNAGSFGSNQFLVLAHSVWKMLPFSDVFLCQPRRDETKKGASRCVYNARTLKDLNCPSTITKNVYCDLKNLDILKPFRGCRSGKSVKYKLKPQKAEYSNSSPMMRIKTSCFEEHSYSPCKRSTRW